MAKSVKVLLFDAVSLIADQRPVTLDCPEIRKTPRDCIATVREHILSRKLSTIRTYSGDVLNYLGQMIYNKELPASEVFIVLPSGAVKYYDNDGVLLDWDFSTFSWSQ